MGIFGKSSARGYLVEESERLKCLDLTRDLLSEGGMFCDWSGSGRKGKHHYGKHGLIIHTAEVAHLVLVNNKELNLGLDEAELFLSALYHDSGKIYDYQPVEGQYSSIGVDDWAYTDHKHLIHHITRSVLIWNEDVNKVNQDSLATSGTERYDFQFVDRVTHNILSHHGMPNWGSPVPPQTQAAWLLHLCDCISARMNDCGRHLSD